MLRFLLGVATGAVAVLLANPGVANKVRPVAKAALKNAMKAVHSAQVGGAELAGAAEDLFAEAKMEATTEILTEAMAAAQAKATTKAAPNGPQKPAVAAAIKPAVKRAPRRRTKTAKADA